MLDALRCRPVSWALLAVLNGASGVGAHAQDASQTEVPSHSGSIRHAPLKTLEAITVHAEGHAEQLQKAAAPITVFNDATIQDIGIQGTGDFIRYVPNMSFDTSYDVGNSFVTARGIQQINNADAPVAIVVDGVPQNNQKEARMNLFDIEQIEVLRGPQGALYGRNAMGGAIVIATKQPTDVTEGFVQAGLGNGGSRKLSAALSGPLAKGELFYRVALAADQFDGTIRNSYTGQLVDNHKSHDVRAQLKWLPGPGQEVELRLGNSLLWGGAIYDTSFAPGTPDDTNIWQAPISSQMGHAKRRITDATLRYRWTLPDAVFVATTGYTNLGDGNFGTLDWCNPQVCPGGFLGIFGPVTQEQMQHVRQLSQELRLSSVEGAPVQWTAGVFGIHTNRNVRTVGTAYPTPSIPTIIVDSNEADRNLAWAVFGQVQVPMTDVDRFSLSMRYDHDRRMQTDLATGAQRSRDFGAWQPKLTWSHDLSATQQVYATVAEGFRSGGFNGVGGGPFLGERLTNFEIGYKSSWLDHRLTFNTALFHDIDHNYQFFYIDLDAGGAQVISNLKRVRIDGLESEVDWLVRPGWELFGSLGLLRTRIDEVGTIGTDLPIRAGNRLPRSEPYNAVLGSQWNFMLAGRSAMFRFDVSRKGARTWEPDNINVMDPVTLANVRMTWFGGEQWNVSAWATNLFNHHYYADYIPNTFSGIGRDVAWPAPGRLYGIDFRYDF